MSLRSQADRKHIAPSFVPARATGQPLDSVTRTVMESRFGHDFSRVRLHAGEDAQRSAERLGATAYTVGTDIVFGPDAHDRARLAHELTHVVQQTRGDAAGGASEALESEAQRNSERVSLGIPARVDGRAARGMVQCQDKDDDKKPKGKFSEESGFTLKPDSIKNKFGFKAELSVPLFPDAKKGPVSFLNKLAITESGSKESESLPGPADIKALQTEAALTLVGLELPKLAVGRLGTLSLEGNIGATGKGTLGDKGGPTGALGGTASGDLSFKSASLVPPNAGSLVLTGKAGAEGSVEQPSGANAKTTAKASTKVTAGTEFESRPLGGPAATFLGLLGRKATVSLGAAGNISGAAETDKHPAVNVGGTGTFGLTGTGKDHRFLKIEVSGDAALDLTKGGKLDPASKATSVKISIGFNF